MVLEKLLENRTKVNFIYRGYYIHTTAATLAVVLNSYRCLRLLLDFGADDDFHEIEVITATGWAKRLKWSETLQVLQDARYGECSIHEEREEHEGWGRGY